MQPSQVKYSIVWIMMMRSVVTVAVGSTSVSRQDDWFLIRPSILISIPSILRFFVSTSVKSCGLFVWLRVSLLLVYSTVQLYRSGAFVLFCFVCYVS